jgi:hypothetical protein
VVSVVAAVGGQVVDVAGLADMPEEGFQTKKKEKRKWRR